MVQVTYITAADRGNRAEVISGTTPIRDYLNSKNALMQAQFSLNGSILSQRELEMTFDEVIDHLRLNADAPIQLFEVAKTAGAR